MQQPTKFVSCKRNVDKCDDFISVINKLNIFLHKSEMKKKNFLAW